jgi:aminoglycoside phosphotransferase (APT) family kinase protein
MDAVVESAEEIRRVELDRLDELARTAWRVLYERHLHIGMRGEIARHRDTGAPLLDDGPVLAAIDRLLTISESRRKLLGVDAPAKVTVLTMDAIGAEAPDEVVLQRFADDAMWIGRGEAKPISDVYAENGVHLLARDVAAFVRALHGVDPAGGPVKPPGSRGAALVHADEGVRRALPRLAEHDNGFDVAAAEAAWAACLTAPGWDREPVWIHGDLQPGNLITDRGRLAAVIDFGALGVGDPAPDVAPALWTFTGAAREAYREAIGTTTPPGAAPAAGRSDLR